MKLLLSPRSFGWNLRGSWFLVCNNRQTAKQNFLPTFLKTFTKGSNASGVQVVQISLLLILEN